jgi:hypothetical protein
MIRAYMTDPVTLRILSGRDAWQEPAWNSLPVMAKVEWGSRLVRNAKGEQVTAAAVVYLPPSVSQITHEDRVMIDGIEHAIIRIERKEDFSFSHVEVFIQ